MINEVYKSDEYKKRFAILTYPLKNKKVIHRLYPFIFILRKIATSLILVLAFDDVYI